MADQNKNNMKEMWGDEPKSKMLREISYDMIVPKKHDFEIQNEIHEVIRNDSDYDDWEYGTEPIPLSEWKP
jgi:hypothetical protein